MNRSYWAAATLLTALSLGDAALSLYGFDHGATEMNPLVTRLPVSSWRWLKVISTLPFHVISFVKLARPIRMVSWVIVVALNVLCAGAIVWNLANL